MRYGNIAKKTVTRESGRFLLFNHMSVFSRLMNYAKVSAPGYETFVVFVVFGSVRMLMIESLTETMRRRSCLSTFCE